MADLKQTPRHVAWHYTSGTHANGILREGLIRLEIGQTAKREKPAVWFTSSPIFEPTALAAIQKPDGSIHQFTSPAEQARLTGGLVRFGVAAKRLHTYSDWTEKSRCPALMQQALEAVAIRAGSNPSQDWLVSFKPVKADAWVAIEHSADGLTWLPLEAAA